MLAPLLFALACASHPGHAAPPIGGAAPARGPAPDTSAPTPTDRLTPVVLADGLRYWVLKEGTGRVAASDQLVKVQYTGWLKNGPKFDSSQDRGRPFTFTLGAGQVIKGWDEGLIGMKIGEKRQLEIPSNLGYGLSGAGVVVKPGATLVFEVELLAILDG